MLYAFKCKFEFKKTCDVKDNLWQKSVWLKLVVSFEIHTINGVDLNLKKKLDCLG